jgi:hypothetical protein
MQARAYEERFAAAAEIAEQATNGASSNGVTETASPSTAATNTAAESTAAA